MNFQRHGGAEERKIDTGRGTAVKEEREREREIFTTFSHKISHILFSRTHY